MAAPLPRLLLLGDSIRMSYQPHVTELLAGRAEVVGPKENCQTSGKTRTKVAEWIEELGTPNVVHWNNGLWDAGHNPEREPVQIPLEEYVVNLRAILAALRATGATVVWATTTPVHPDRAWKEAGWSWRNDEIARYNAAALDVMRAEGVPVDDLHHLVGAQPDLYYRDDQLHLNEVGQKACAKAVVKAVEPYL